MRTWSPNLALLVVALACVAATLLALVQTLAQPWLGLTLRAEGNAVLVADVAPSGPSGLLAPDGIGWVLTGLSAGPAGAVVPVRAGDIAEDPDILESHAAFAAFFARQSALYGVLARKAVALHLSGPDGATAVVEVSPGRRPVGDLPATFWPQLVTGVGGMIIGAWVFALRPRDWAARMFALSGLGLMLSAGTAAVYSSRELAMDGGLFHVLSLVNTLGACFISGAVLCLFLAYPKPLVRPAWLLVVPAVLGSAWGLHVFGLTRGPSDIYVSTAVQMVLVLALIGVQWRLTRNDPPARAALYWLGLAVAIGGAGFVIAIVIPVLVRGEAPVAQGYAFLSFLVGYGVCALGVRRYRLFEIDQWAFRVLFYTVAALLLAGVDALLILVLQLEPASSLSIALLAVGFVYLPMRDTLWHWMVARPTLAEHDLFRAVLDVAFGASPAERAGRWHALVARIYAPLEIVPTEAGREPELRLDGIELALPAAAQSPALLLRYGFKGKGLFGPPHVELARQLVSLMHHAEAGRSAHERGAGEERRRIAKDLHDDVGARLLTALHRPDLESTRATVREALADMRTLARGLAGERLPLAQIVADLRHETARRLERSGIALDWPLDVTPEGPLETAPAVDYPIYRNLISAVREVVSNVLRHSQARHLRIAVDYADGWVVMTAEDDGLGIAGKAAGGGPPGYGLANMGQRAADLNGWVRFPEVSQGFAVRLALPVATGQPPDGPPGAPP